MAEATADEVYDQFKTALRGTLEEWTDPVLKFQCENGMADWSLNDEEHVLLTGISRNVLAKILCHVLILSYGAEERYISDIDEESALALQELEATEDATDEEKIIGAELIEVGALAQADGYSHCVALIHGWALAAVSADEGETVDWDDLFREGKTNE